MTDLTSFLVFAFAVFFIAQLVRAFPWPEWLRQRKPLSCNACMAFWSALVVSLSHWQLLREDPDAGLPFLGAAGAAYLLMAGLDRLQSAAWPMPPLDSTAPLSIPSPQLDEPPNS